MATEIELKFIAPPGAWRRLMALGWVKRAARGKAKSVRLHALYFDTPRLSLAKAKTTLRIRSDGHARVQTIKTASSGGIERGEWEAPVRGDRPDLKAITRMGAKLPLKKHKRKALQRVFETRVVRKTVILKAGRSEIELAFDQGAIVARGAREPLHEIEIELKKGRRSDLLRLGARLARALSLEYGLWAKAERGYALVARTKNRPRSAETAPLDPGMAAADALRAIGFSCLRQFDGNRGAILEQESEGLHQARIGLRRLRVALALFPGLDRAGARLDREAKYFVDRLTPARDFDVFLQDHLLPHCRLHHANKGLRLLKRAALEHRGHEFAKLAVLAESGRWRKLVLDGALWLAKDGAAGKNKAHSLRHLARQGFHRLDRRIVKDMASFERLDARRRHKLRIRVKTLRYAVEFFEGLYGGGRTQRQARHFAASLKALQDILGSLNDIEVHSGLLNRLIKDRHWRDPGETFELGMVRQEEVAERIVLLKAALRAARRYRHAPRFWV